MYGTILIESMLEEFGDELQLCDGRPPTTSDVELIAFNTWCHWEDGYDTDFDFHFRVYRDGKWMEKSGYLEVNECELDEWGKYNGDVSFFYHRIGVDND